MNDGRHEPADEWIEEESTISLREIASTLGRYKVPILLTIGILFLLWALGATVLLLRSPSERQAELPFRLEFKGAERGEYPNGTKFEATEILSAPVLLSVYNANQLDRYLPFSQFRSAVFVLQSNAALEQLIRQYRARLSEPRLSAVDRERLEAEFAEKKASIAQSDYSLVFSVPEKAPAIPRKLQAKVLSDLLHVWAEQTVQNKGVVLYDLSILSSGMFEQQSLDTYDYVIALDMLRSRIQRVIGNIDELLEIPGSKVVRSTGPDSASLAELLVRLEDTLQFRVQPLLGLVLTDGISRSPSASIRFLETQLRFNEIERQEAERSAEAVRESLDAYVRQQQGGTSSERAATTREPFASSQGGTTIIPQLSDTFLQQIMDMASSDADLEYRQGLVNDLREESMKIVPLEAEAEYYRQLLASLRGFESRGRSADEAGVAEIRSQIASVTEDAIRITNQVNQIYREISQNLNPSTVLYSTTQPTFFTIERSVPLSRLLLAGVLILLLGTSAAVAGALIHHRITARRDGDAVEERELKLDLPPDSQPKAPGEISPSKV